MVCYLLLRNNVETGPFSLEEIISKSLKSTDLIWIEGQSTAWKYPGEIETLQSFVANEQLIFEPTKTNDKEITTAAGIFVALPSPLQQEDADQKEMAVLSNAEDQLHFVNQPENGFETDTEDTSQQSIFKSQKTFSKAHSAVWLGCVLAGLLLSAMIIKKLVEAYNENATGIVTAAAMPATDLDYFKGAHEENPYQNALTMEVIPIDTATKQVIKKAPKKINLKKLVQLDVNDYQVGLLGGIKNLRMLVTNKSGYVLNKIKIELKYLKPNGDIVKTENLVMNAVAPKSSKSLAVAAQKRGVKISYRITDIQSKQNAANMVSL